MKIGATLITHNCFQFDYCLEASIDSVLGVADELIVVDGQSTDETKPYLIDRAAKDARIRVVDHPWEPNAHGHWLAEMSNFGRKQLTSPYHIYLQADEVLHESSYPAIRLMAHRNDCAAVRRLNFWRDSASLVPPGQICGHNIVRCGPSSVPIVGDAESMDPKHARGVTDKVRIFHYGFLRRRDCFFAKSKEMQTAFFGKCDPRLTAAEEEQSEWSSKIIDPESLSRFGGTHPRFIRQWLAQRGFPHWPITPGQGDFNDSTTICHALAKDAQSVLDLGCGEAHHTKDIPCDTTFVDIDGAIHTPPGTITANLIEWAQRCSTRFSVVFMLDVIEHLTKETGRAHLRRLEEIAERIVIFTPSGELWVGNGNTPHDHYCGWTARELSDMGYTCWEWPAFHKFSDGNTHGAFWAWKDIGRDNPSVENIARQAGVSI